MGLVLSGGITRARDAGASSASGDSKPTDYSGFRHAASQRDAAVQRAMRRRVALDQPPDSAPTIISSAAAASGAARSPRERAVDEELDVRPDRALLVDDAKAQPGEARVERARARRRASRAAASSTVSAPVGVGAQQAGDADDHRAAAGDRCAARHARLTPLRPRRCAAGAARGISSCALRRGCPRPRRSSCRSKRPLSAPGPPSSPGA